MKIVNFGKNSEDALSTPFPEKKLTPEHYGNLTRDQLSRVYVDLINTYKEMVYGGAHMVHGIFFIFSENGKDVAPLAYPIMSGGMMEDPQYMDKEIEKMIVKYPPETFKLEMITYCQDAIDDSNPLKTSVIPVVVFGARDLAGVMIHSAYCKVGDPKTNRVMLKPTKMAGDIMHSWIPPKRMKKDGTPEGETTDTLLEYLTARYAMASSLGQIISGQFSSTTLW